MTNFKQEHLESVLTKHFGYKGEGLDGPEWIKAYNKLIAVIELVGILTGCPGYAYTMVKKLDAIDSRDGEIKAIEAERGIGNEGL